MDDVCLLLSPSPFSPTFAASAARTQRDEQHSNWPTYPQLYVNGELVGGLDIMKETKESGSLRADFGIKGDSTASSAGGPMSLDDRLKHLVKKEPIMLFMKGLPSAPFCGFSKQIVDILDTEDVAYGAFNILEDEEVRQGLKKFRYVLYISFAE